MEQYEKYSVLITDDKGKRGTGTLFYTKGSTSFYVLTCAHVIYTSQAVTIHIVLSDDREESVRVTQEHFHFSPIDEPTVVGNESTHTCDIAVIECPKGEIPLAPTHYAMYPMTSGERILAVGYPNGTSSSVYYQQDELSGKVLRVQSNQDYFVIRVDEGFLNASDREAELKGFSGSPVWDEQKIEDSFFLLGGLIAFGVGSNISRGRVNVVNARILQSLMKDEFGITIETRLPMVDDDEIAPGFEEPAESPDQITVRSSWVENERRKAQTYVDTLQLQKAVDISRAAIGNSEFVKCTNEQKVAIYSVLQEAYRLARDYDVYDQIGEEMRQAGIVTPRDDLMEAVRYYEAQEIEKAEEYIYKALEKNPNGNEEQVLAIAIRATKENGADISILSEVLGPHDQLLIKPKDEKEEEFIYQALGFVLSNIFRETTRGLRCLNRAFQVSGNYIILESLALTYYQHSIRDAFIEAGKDKIDREKIELAEIEKARDAFLCVFSAADEMWLKGAFRRNGLPIFKCFCFMHDNFRIYKHYHDVMKYVDFPDHETKRDIQLCYLDVAIRKGAVNLEEFDALTEHDRKFYELVISLDAPMRWLGGLTTQAQISEDTLAKILVDGEAKLKELVDTQMDDRLGFDGLHSTFANLYGNAIMRYKWQAISEVKRHCGEIKSPKAIETFQIFIDELQTEEFDAIEKRYEAYFEEHRDIISFEEWCHFYARHGQLEKVKCLYDSVFEERKFLIEAQPEYFYREYINFMLVNRFDLTPALRCLVERKNEFKDIFIYMSFEMDLKFATCTFNDPDQMLDDAKMLLDEGLYTEEDYNEKCLIINMLNCRPAMAEKYAGWAHGVHPALSSEYERMLHIWKGVRVVPNPHWDSMQGWIAKQLFDVYEQETWLRNPKEILLESRTEKNRAVVVDLWTLYFFIKIQRPEIMAMFETIYVTHDTVSVALQEINHVNDDDIRRVLVHLQTARNVKLLSPTLEQQLAARNDNFAFMEIHSACLLAQEQNCPAFVGEVRFPIPENLRSKVIRPNSLKSIIDCLNGERLIRESHKR